MTNDNLSDLVRSYDRRRSSADTLKRLERRASPRLVCPKCRRVSTVEPGWLPSQPCGCGVAPVEVAG